MVALLNRPSYHRLLSTFFRIEPGEGLRAGLMLLYSVAVVGGVVITGQLASRALFLSGLPPSDVPFKFILPPLALMLASVIYARIAGRFRRDRLIVGSCIVMILGVAGFRLLLLTDQRQDFTTLCALFVVFDVIGDLAILQFWTFAGDIFNAREARRLFALIAGGSTVANIVFGLALSSSASTMLPQDLLLVMIASLVVCMLCAATLGRRHSGDLDATLDDSGSDPSANPLSSTAKTLAEVFRSPLAATLGGLVVLGALVSTIADYQLDLALQARYSGDSQGMVGFLGLFRFLAGLGAGVLQFFLAGRLMERSGVAAVLLLLPASMALGSGAVLLTGGLLWAAAIPRACDVVLKYTVNNAALNLLYLPMSSGLRARAKTVIDGVVMPPFVSLLGVVFLLLGASGRVSIEYWAAPMLFLIAIWLLLVRRVSRQYVRALAESVQLRRLDLDQARLDLSDESSVGVIRSALSAADPMQVVHALSLLPRIPSTDWTEDVTSLLDHPSDEVRAAALDCARSENLVAATEAVIGCLRDSSILVRAAAVEALCVLLGEGVVPHLQESLRDQSARVRSTAVMGLSRYAGPASAASTREHLSALVGHGDVEVQVEAARVLGSLEAPLASPYLEDLLDHLDLEVQMAAIRAAARVESPRLVPALIGKLQHPATATIAADALARCLDEDLSDIEPTLGDLRQPEDLRRQLIRLLGTVPSEPALRILLDRFDDEIERFRGEAYDALLRRRDRLGLDLPLSPESLARAVERETDAAYDLHLLRAAIGGGESGSEDGSLLLNDALTVRVIEARDRLVALLDMLHPEISCERVRESLATSDRRRRAAAIELIDNVVDRRGRDTLLPLFGSAPEALRAAENHRSFDVADAAGHLRHLAQSQDDWIRACVLFDVGWRRLDGCEEMVEEAARDPDPRIRETALFALRRLSNQGESPMALSLLEKVFFLKSVPLFEHISGEEIIDIVPILREVEIEPGDTFIKMGDEGDCLYIIVEGEVIVSLEGGAQSLFSSREVLGELAVLAEQPRSADCSARTRVVALRIDKADFWQLMNERPQITIEVMKVLVGRYVPGPAT